MPKIVLRYNSGVVDDQGIGFVFSQADWAGLGWSLDVGGFVMRESKGTITLSDDTFKLVFGGDTHDLIWIGGSSYRTKDETFLSINYSSGSDSWTVKTKDGTTHRFGYNPDSRGVGLTFATNQVSSVVFRYFLDEVSTTSGVGVRYSYFKQSSNYNGWYYDQAVYPNTITYAYRNNSLIDTAREVKFLRVGRTDWTDVSPTQHASYHELYKLDAIEVKVGASLVRRYNFTHDYSIDRAPWQYWGGGAAGDLTLKTITTLGTDGTTSLPPFTFTYSGPVLASANNGIGGSVSYAYEKITPLYRYCLREHWEDYSCLDWGPSVTGHEPGYDPAPTALGVIVEQGAGTVPIYNKCLKENPETSSCLDWAADNNPWGHYSDNPIVLLGYGWADASEPHSLPLYRNCVKENPESGGCVDWAVNNATFPHYSYSDIVFLGYMYAGKLDGPRHRVTSRTQSDGRGWSSTTTFKYWNPDISADGKEFRGHSLVRATDPLGNYTDTWFYQDDYKKGRAYQTETRSNTGALFNRVVNTFSTPNTYTGVTFVRLDRSDYFECEGQTTCHQNAETFAYDSYGNRTHKYDLGDVPTGGDERTEVTTWVVDASNWIHRPTGTVLQNASGGTVRERWMYYDNQAHGNVGTRGLLTKEEARLGGNAGNSGNPTVTHSYDVYGNRTSTTDARSCTTNMVFDGSQALPTSVTNCLNHSSSTTYHSVLLQPQTQTDANNQPTNYEYDVFGRTTKVIGPLDSPTNPTTLIEYLNWGSPSAQLVKTSRREQHNQAGVIWSEEYFDGLGRGYKSQQEGPGGQTVVSETLFDSRGLQWKTSAPRFTVETAVWTEFLYDVLGRQTRVNFPDGTNAQTAYDHHEVISTDPRGKVKRTYTDSHHRVSQVEEIESGVSYFTNYFYDEADSLVKVTNSAGHNTHNVYDSLGRKIAMCDPNMGTISTLTSCSITTSGAWLYSYNLAGDLTSQKDAKGQLLCFEYDQLGRSTVKKSATANCTSGTTTLVTWTYDDATVLYSKGRVTQIVDQATTSKFAYDQLGRTTQTQRWFLNAWQTMSQTYDALSRVTSETFPDNETVNYTYNSGGSLQSATSTSGPNYVNDIQYNARGQKTSLTYGNGLVTTWTHHASNFRVTNRATSGNQQNLSYAYDNNGNVTSVTDSLFTATRSFGYDDLNRLTSATGTFGTNQQLQFCTYVFSAIGNLTNKCGAVLSYFDANHPSAVTNHSTLNKNYTYDANGNMLTRGSNQTLVWDIDNRVSSVSITGGGTTSMEYDYSGMRVKKSAPSGTTLYPFQGYEIDPNLVVTKFIKIGGESIASKKGTNKYFYHNDHLGSVNVITNDAGNRVQLIEYDPWGAVSRSEGTIDPDQRFTGQKLDPETGLYYYGGRYYDAEIGRFISADPFIQTPFDPQNLNRYSYVINNPQNYIDPDGFFHQPKKKKVGFFRKFFGFIVGVIVSIVTWNPVIGAAVAGAINAGLNGGNPLLGAIIGGVTAGLTAGLFGGVSPGFDSPAVLTTTQLLAAHNTGALTSAFFNRHIQVAHASGGSGGAVQSDGTPDFGARRRMPGDDGVVPTADEGPPVRFPPWPELVTPFNLPGFFPRVIYRSGRPSPSNLRLRPGEEYLSFRDSLSNPAPKGERPVFRPGDEYFAVDVSKLPPGSVFSPGDVPGHIGVRNVAPDVLQRAVIERGRLPR